MPQNSTLVTLGNKALSHDRLLLHRVKGGGLSRLLSVGARPVPVCPASFERKVENARGAEPRFQSTYVVFVKQLRAKHPHAHFILSGDRLMGSRQEGALPRAELFA